MRVGILAEKIGMSRYYDKSNTNQPVTLLKVSNCKVVSVQNMDKNGYESVTLSHGIAKKVNKPFRSFLKKKNLKPFFRSKEFRVSSNNLKVGDEINATNFIVGQYVDVSSNSIGKGFAGGMKRHNFSGNRATHGVSISHRSHGSTGQCQDPGKVFKGKKMAGRLGNKKITMQNLMVLKVDKENNLLIVKGAVPGHKGSIVKVVDAIKKKQNIQITNEPQENTSEVENNNNNAVSEQPKKDLIEGSEKQMNSRTENNNEVDPSTSKNEETKS